MAQNVPSSPMMRLFQYGWFAPNLVSSETHQQYAAIAGFRLRMVRDLTQGIHIRALPWWLAQFIGWCRSMWQGSTLLRSMVGSMALQQCLAAGSIRYKMMVFEKQ
jgi:hypothetical protein